MFHTFPVILFLLYSLSPFLLSVQRPLYLLMFPCVSCLMLSLLMVTFTLPATLPNTLQPHVIRIVACICSCLGLEGILTFVLFGSPSCPGQ